MRCPISVCCRMNATLAARRAARSSRARCRGSRACRHRGAAPRGRAPRARHRRVPSSAASSRLRRRNAADVHAQVRLALLERLQEHGVRPAAGHQHLVLLGVEALVGDPERLLGVRRLLGQDRAAERRRDVEALALLGQRIGRPVRGTARSPSSAPERACRTRRRRAGSSFRARRPQPRAACPSRASSASPAGWPNVSL